ncbi:MAG: hypothetical protein CMJ18_04245 [Phycisphaeraceae bacterium]|nr:hypothetical protein [Phycisphaeraceae bacterium]
MPFVPDLTDWYAYHRTEPGRMPEYCPGALIPDASSIHECPGTMPERFKDFTLLDFHRTFDWGFHAHVYDWCETSYTNGVERVVENREWERLITLRTPRGCLVHRDQRAADGSWCPCEHFVKSIEDLRILDCAIESEVYTPHYDRVESVLAELNGLGQCDLVVYRSPFGKLVQEYMGFEGAIYAMADEPDAVEGFLALQEARDLEVIRLAGDAPARLVIISDHADENLIAPPMYKQHCVPYYRKATSILHEKGKFVSTHLDGNFKGHFALLQDTGFDLLDGCTPAPMSNYEVEELAAALPDGMCAFCGVPATFFCQDIPVEQILTFGDRIIDALRGRGVLNVGDIVPANGNIEPVIALGEHVNCRFGKQDE